MLERDVQALVRLEISKEGAVGFRQNVAACWTGDAKRIGPRTVLIENARFIKTGLCVGSSDVIGWKSVVITPEMVGLPVAVFLAVETKSESGRASKEQKNFLERVSEAGGIAILARSAQDVAGGLRNWITRRP